MKRLHVGWLLLLVLVLMGCDEVVPPSCDKSVLALQNPGDLPGFSVEQAEYGLVLTNTAAPTTTFILSARHFEQPLVHAVGQQKRLLVQTSTIKNLPRSGSRYPHCVEPFTASASVPITVLQNGRRRQVMLAITSAPNAAVIVAHERYLEEQRSRQREVKVMLVLLAVVFAAVCLGVLALLAWAIKKLMTM